MTVAIGPPGRRESKRRQYLSIPSSLANLFGLGARVRVTFAGTIGELNENEGEVNMTVEADDVNLSPTTMDDAARLAERVLAGGVVQHNLGTEPGRAGRIHPSGF